jgi:uncharacterized protein (TIGR03000 family)
MKGAAVVYATRLLLASSFVFALLTATSARAENRPFRRARPDRNHMPGWDANRIYPWSPYNYGRNPYNPIITPYPPPYYPLPYYGSYRQPEDYGGQPVYEPEDRSLSTMYGPHNISAPDGAMFPSHRGQSVGLPQPTGELKLPPPGAAIVQVRVPATFAHVLFDGERTYTSGTTRYFVTPELPDGKTCHYTVSASWKDGDNDAQKERKVEVTAGHTTLVDFTRPADKKSP